VPSRGSAKPPTPAPDPVRDAYAARPWLTAYPASVPPDIDIPDIPVHRMLTEAAAAYPNRTAIAFLGSSTTYRELAQQVERFATGLADLGVERGDRVALVLPNCPQFLVAFFAALRAGAVVVPLNPLGTEAELQRQLSDCGVAVVVCLDKTFATVDAARRRTGVQHVIVTSIADYLPMLQRSLLRLPVRRARRRREQLTATLPRSAEATPFVDVMRATGRAPQVTVNPAEDLAAVQYTGGTTGVTRGAMLTHRNLVANAHQVRAWYADGQPGREVTLAVLPLFHTYGLTLCLTTTTLLASTLVLLPRFDLDVVLAAIDEHKPTLFPGVPPIYKALVDSPKARRHDLSSIRTCVSGAMRLPPETQEQFERATGGRLVEGYGMTETSPVTHANPLQGARKAGSIGVPLPNTQCRIVDPEHPEQAVAPGEPGEIAIGGPQVFRGYWGDPETGMGADATGLFTTDGYLLTGDIGVMDDDGFFSVVDRKKELIIVGGFNIYPSEIESVLRAHPGVSDACVIGIPDRYRGETVKAFVVTQPAVDVSAADLLEHCGRELTAYKVPRQLEFRGELPRSDVGKVLRRLLRDEELAKLAADAADAPKPRKTPARQRTEDPSE
jgi:long-chain acyl-CoA synthetase